MQKDQTIGKAIVFIENNLYEPIAASDAARAVSYSYYHFHRYFQAVMGETIGSYIRSRRLTQAAWDLVHTNRKVLDIAVSLYFETAEGFTRAFKERYGLTPTDYRRNGIDVLIGRRQSAQSQDSRIITHAGLRPEITVTDRVRLAGIRFRTDDAARDCPGMWEQFTRMLASCPDILPPGTVLNAGNRYGVFEAEESCTAAWFNENSGAGVFLGIEIPDGLSIGNRLEEKVLPGGKYAKFVHRGTAGELIDTYHYIWGVWFPKSGYRLAGRDDFERYTERFLGTEDENSEIEIYFPVE